MTLTWTSSELLTGKKFQDKGLLIAFKNGKQSYSSVTVPRPDADIIMTLPEPAAEYLVEVNIGTMGNTSGDIVLQWDVTGDATVYRTTQAMTVPASTSSDTNLLSVSQSVSAQASGTAMAPAPCAVREKMLVFTSAEPSILTLWWAQNTSSTTSSSVTDYGWAVARRLS
jgi:hypothetical protein